MQFMNVYLDRYKPRLVARPNLSYATIVSGQAMLFFRALNYELTWMHKQLVLVGVVLDFLFVALGVLLVQALLVVAVAIAVM